MSFAAAEAAIAGYRSSLQKTLNSRNEEIETKKKELAVLLQNQEECKSYLMQCDAALKLLRNKET